MIKNKKEILRTIKKSTLTLIGLFCIFSPFAARSREEGGEVREGQPSLLWREGRGAPGRGGAGREGEGRGRRGRGN